MMEPVCDYCGASDKFRCKDLVSASKCLTFNSISRVETSVSEVYEEQGDYELLTDYDWISYELATIFHDYSVSEKAQAAIMRCIANYIRK